MEGYHLGVGRGRKGEMVQGLRGILSRSKIDRRYIENSIGNGEVKELTLTNRGHELRGEDCWRQGGYQTEVGKERKLGQL